MLKSLYIKNFALLDEISVEFGEGLNIITGETGAGKSIIIEALGLVLGERASVEMIRTGADKSIVEGSFHIKNNRPPLVECLTSNGIEYSDDIVIRREISAKGLSRAFVNDTQVTNAVLKTIGDLLTDMHGQHEHQSLLNPEMHVDFLDDYGTLGNLAKEVKNSHQKISTLYDELNTLKAKEKQLKEKRDLYEFQFNEINQINPRIDDEEELERGKNILENSEKLFGDTKYIYETLYEEKDSIFEKLAKIEDILHELSEIDKSFEEMKSECTTAKINVEDIAKFAEKYNSKIKFDPERLEAIRNRLGEFYKLKKKYGGTLKSVIEYKEEIEAELKLSESFDLEIEKLEKEIHSAKIIFSEQCVKISNERKTVAKKLEENIVKILSELGMEKSKFYVNFRMEKDKDGWAKIGNENYSATSKGVDIIEFYISPNPGEELKPLVKIASGGEISRIMLALKSLLAESDKIPTLIFDEIDIGVSGRIALALGKNLKKLSRSHQTLCITHLPQVAAMSDKHYSVSKVIEGKRTITQIRELSKNERITEIAKLLGGETVTETNIKNARELMEIAI